MVVFILQSIAVRKVPETVANLLRLALQRGLKTENALQSNFEYPNLLELHEIVQIIKGLDNRKYGY